MEPYFSLGDYTRSISTNSKEAETWFNRGLNWCYAFHHKEALRCFQKTVDLDPDCAMGYWGIAYASGPYYNIPWAKMPPHARPQIIATTHEHARKAVELAAAGNATPLEQALCTALMRRFQASAIDDPVGLAQWDDDYADAMRTVYREFPEDYDVCALTAEALIVRTPWQLWDLQDRVPAEGTDTNEAIAIIEAAFDRIEKNGDVQHPGLLHFYIHIMEMSPEPERALAASDILRPLLPDAGHLVHMPSHIYVLCGQYEKTIACNIEAAEADKKYLAVDSELGIYYIYLLHNIHFQLYGALFSGQYEPAIRAANEMEATVKPEYLQVDNAFLVNYLEAFYGMKAHVLVRFGKWQEILDAPLPEDPELFCVTHAFWQYAKGIAHAVLGNIDDALKQQSLLREAVAAIPDDRIVFQNESRDILSVAGPMLAGELEYRRRNYDIAFSHLRQAVELYDTLNYSEPWSWMMPPRHALGALLLEQNRVDEAARVYRADLGLDDTLVRPSQHPDNIWSLLGYAECCERSGDWGNLKTIQPALEKARAIADSSIEVSCFCRTDHLCCD
jgi:tetratricopeptide (TPR) repeat protein